MTAQNEKEEHLDLVATAAAISHTFNLFESIRRRVCRQVGWAYEWAVPGVSTRSEGSVRVRLLHNHAAVAKHTQAPSYFPELNILVAQDGKPPEAVLGATAEKMVISEPPNA